MLLQGRRDMQIHYAPIPNAVQCRYVLFGAGPERKLQGEANAKFVSLCVSKAQTSQRSLSLHPLPSPVILFTLHGAFLPLSIACPSRSRSPSQTAHAHAPSPPFGFPSLRLRLTLLFALRRCRTSTTSTRVAASLICPLSGRSQPQQQQQQQHSPNQPPPVHAHTDSGTHSARRPPSAPRPCLSLCDSL